MLRNIGLLILLLSSILWGSSNFQSKTTYRVSPTFSITVFEGLDETDSSPLSVLEPDTDQVLISDSIKFKGVNRLLTPAFVNSIPANVKSDGRFMGSYTFDSYGKHILTFSVITSDFNLIETNRFILRLAAPPDLDDYTNLRNTYTYMYNIGFIYTNNYTRKLSDPFTRGDLAYLLSRLNGQEDTGLQLTHSFYPDVDETHWAFQDIHYAAMNEFMLAFPDGTFKPDQPVTLLEYLISITKGLHLKLESKQTPLPYKQINGSHWTAKFVRTARNNKLLPQTGDLNLNAELTIADLIELIHGNEAISEKFDALLDFSTGYKESEKEKIERYKRIAPHIADFKDKTESIRKLLIETPTNNQIILSNTVPFRGRIYPSEEFKINGLTVSPDLAGKFSLVLPLKLGENYFEINALGKNETITLYSLIPFSDLDGHWVEETAAKLRYIDIFSKSSKFNPRELITRADFAKYVIKAFDIKAEINKEITPKDVSLSDRDYSDIMTIISAEIMTLSNDYFYPNDNMTKVEALTALLRAEKIELSEESTKDLPELPFNDIPKNHWAYTIIQTALKENIIAPSQSFNPNKEISKAELASLLYNIPSIKQKVLDALTN